MSPKTLGASFRSKETISERWMRLIRASIEKMSAMNASSKPNETINMRHPVSWTVFGNSSFSQYTPRMIPITDMTSNSNINTFDDFTDQYPPRSLIFCSRFLFGDGAYTSNKGRRKMRNPHWMAQSISQTSTSRILLRDTTARKIQTHYPSTVSSERNSALAWPRLAPQGCNGLQAVREQQLVERSMRVLFSVYRGGWSLSDAPAYLPGRHMRLDFFHQGV